MSTPDFFRVNQASMPHPCVDGTTAGGAVVVVPRPEFEADLASPPPVDIRPRGRNLELSEPVAQHFYRRVVRRRHGQGTTLTQEFIEVDENCNPQSGKFYSFFPSASPCLVDALEYVQCRNLKLTLIHLATVILIPSIPCVQLMRLDTQSIS